MEDKKCGEGKTQFKFSVNGLTFTSNEMPHLILGRQVIDTSDDSKLYVNTTETVKSYSKMYYTTDITALGFILGKLTLRSSSLANAKLNDTMEKERVGISQYAGSRFITCFSHKDNENVHFWYNYGGNDRSLKVLLKFNNFASRIIDTIHTDYCLTASDKKVFFFGKNYIDTVKQNSIQGMLAGLPRINEDYDLRNCVTSLEMFDVDYLPVDDEQLTRDYSSEVTIEFNAKNAASSPREISGIMAYDPNCLGKQKSNPWEDEKESRILCCLEHQEFSDWEYIDLRLKEEIFRGLTIVLSPWLAPDLEDRVREIVKESPISDEIKETIRIEHSVLEGKIQ